MIQREKRALPRRACTKTIGIRSYVVGRVDCTKIAPDDFEPKTTPTIAQLLEALHEMALTWAPIAPENEDAPTSVTLLQAPLVSFSAND